MADMRPPQHCRSGGAERDNGLKPLWRKKEEHVARVLEHCNHDLDAAAEVLGVTPRELRQLMRQFEMNERNAGSESEQPSRKPPGR